MLLDKESINLLELLLWECREILAKPTSLLAYTQAVLLIEVFTPVWLTRDIPDPLVERIRRGID